MQTPVGRVSLSTSMSNGKQEELGGGKHLWSYVNLFERL